MRFVAMRDLHLSKKPWQVRKALNMAKESDAVLLAGDLVNDGKPEQFEEMYRCIEDILPDTPAFSALAHNPKRGDRQPYLSRDDQLQRIIDAHRNIIFISGHTHVSMNSDVSCVERDKLRSNIYINDGSIRPTTVMRADGKVEQAPDTGNIVCIDIDKQQVRITPVPLVRQC